MRRLQPWVAMATCTAASGVMPGGEKSATIEDLNQTGASFDSRQKDGRQAAVHRAVTAADAPRSRKRLCRGAAIGRSWHTIERDRMVRTLPCDGHVGYRTTGLNVTSALKRVVVVTVVSMRALFESDGRVAVVSSDDWQGVLKSGYGSWTAPSARLSFFWCTGCASLRLKRARHDGNYLYRPVVLAHCSDLMPLRVILPGSPLAEVDVHTYQEYVTCC